MFLFIRERLSRFWIIIAFAVFFRWEVSWCWSCWREWRSCDCLSSKILDKSNKTFKKMYLPCWSWGWRSEWWQDNFIWQSKTFFWFGIVVAWLLFCISFLLNDNRRLSWCCCGCRSSLRPLKNLLIKLTWIFEIIWNTLWEQV